MNLSVLHVPSAYILAISKRCDSLCHTICVSEQPQKWLQSVSWQCGNVIYDFISEHYGKVGARRASKGFS